MAVQPGLCLTRSGFFATQLQQCHEKRTRRELVTKFKGYNVGWLKWSIFSYFFKKSCFVVAVCDLVQNVEAIVYCTFLTANSILKSFLKYE